MLPGPLSPDFDCKIACPYIDEGSTGKPFWGPPKLTSILMSYKINTFTLRNSIMIENKTDDTKNVQEKTQNATCY